MTEALRTGEVTEEALAFVAGRAPRPSKDRLPSSQPRTVASAAVAPMPVQPSIAAPIPNDVSAILEHPVPSAGATSITVRLPGSLPPRLLRASLERKLRRQTPFTQQDIVAAALDHWLRAHGYAS
jgi:hypothetical protein